MDVVALGLAKADAKKNYAPAKAATAGSRTPHPIIGDALFQLSTAGQMLLPTNRNRLSVVLRNLSATQTLKVAHGTIDTTTAPTVWTDVPVGSEWASTGAAPVWAWYPTTGELVQIRKVVIA